METQVIHFAQSSDTSEGVGFIFAFLLVNLLCAAWASHLWANKGGSSGAGFALGFFFGILGLVIAAVAQPSSRGSSSSPKWTPGVGDIVTTASFIAIKDSDQGIPAGQDLRVVAIDDGLVIGELPNGGTHRFYPQHLLPKPMSFQEQAADSESHDYDMEIRRLARLRDDGLLTEEEFQTKKRHLLGL
jgi:hypothetical protein